MEYLIYSQDFDLVKKDGKYFVIYEYGGGASYMREQEVTEAEAMEILEDNDRATPIIQKYKNEARRLKGPFKSPYNLDD